MDEILRFEDKADFVEISVAAQDEGEVPSTGDAYITLNVSSSGFTGHNDLWVLATSLHSFCSDLIRLERDRKGEAVLESVQPEELQLRVKSVNSRGHMAVCGVTGHHIQRENSLQWHSVHFGLEFDPSQLQRAVTLEWIKRNAE